ncbi:alanine racemase [Duganella sp. FT92W]|uniref:Alanine racemase n=1 Tax=Pseudoduganella rivuli TaxID=2666085 RepID=A0A7X2LS90_9BURK|nr:alanine racemase [Pseudoduganella rivuli]
MNTPESRAGAVLTIDLAAIEDNYRLLQRRVGAAACAAVLKADAYGLGAAHVAPVLRRAGCRHFFVAHLEEGIALRRTLPAAQFADTQVFVLHGVPPGAEMDLLEHQLTPVLNSRQQLDAWRALARQLGRALPAIVQADTGMSRMGMPPAEVDAWLDSSDPFGGLALQYVMSHLAVADEPDHPMNGLQLARFAALRQRLGGIPGSLANSSGIFLGADYHFDLARPGVALYGANPQPGQPNPMRPVVTLQGRIVQTRRIAEGDYVGYALSYQAPGERTIATVSVGYADGWLRHLSNRGHVLVDGVRAPVVGRVSMDSITVDVTGIAPARVTPGALVDLLSADQTVDDVAALAGTIGYEILTSLGLRYHRRYTGA